MHLEWKAVGSFKRHILINEVRGGVYAVHTCAPVERVLAPKWWQV